MERNWLPKCADVAANLLALDSVEAGPDRWRALKRLANHDHDFASIVRLDRAIRKEQARSDEDSLGGLLPLKLAILSTSTTSHLPPGIRVAALGRGLLLDVYEPDYGQARQEIADPTSNLHGFAPNAVLFANDPYSLFGSEGANLGDGKGAAQAAVEALRGQWRRVRELWNATVIQQLPFNPAPRIMGENEFRLPGSISSLVSEFQQNLRAAAEEDGVDLIDLDYWTSRRGLDAWHSRPLWDRSKQEVHPTATPLYGDLVARVLAARYGRGAKCLILDLDNTLWGGVIGDDGLEGIVLGQGSAAGEGHLAFQKYAKQLARRGVILAVCSKNDDAVAREAFERHPEMALRLDEIGCFVANWSDKAANIRHVVSQLNIGIDAAVFVDDNPFERELIRRELPDVFVPELSDDPSDYARIVADSGYFECVSVTKDDLARTEQYQSNARRQALLEETTDLDSYLAALDMTLKHGAFDDVGLQRIVQLINKTNQFNLTTRRYSEPEVRQILSEPLAVTRQLRLLDRYGDNGIIGVVIGRLNEASRDLTVETWLMSCRVLGRQVEQATLNVLAEVASAMGARTLTGEFRPTDRNGMVKDHYANLGFAPAGERDGGSLWTLSLDDYKPLETKIKIEALG